MCINTFRIWSEKLPYTQSPNLTDEESESLLKKASIARFCSINEDGTIHAVPVWYSYLEGKIVVATPAASRKARNVRRNGNVTLLIDESETRGIWPKGVVVYGEAKMDVTDLVLEEFTRLCEKYISKDKAEGYAKGLLSLSRWVKIVVTPKHRASFDYTKDQAYKTATGE
jgi:general stress protein 26